MKTCGKLDSGALETCSLNEERPLKEDLQAFVSAYQKNIWSKEGHILLVNFFTPKTIVKIFSRSL